MIYQYFERFLDILLNVRDKRIVILYLVTIAILIRLCVLAWTIDDPLLFFFCALSIVMIIVAWWRRRRLLVTRGRDSREEEAMENEIDLMMRTIGNHYQRSSQITNIGTADEMLKSYSKPFLFSRKLIQNIVMGCDKTIPGSHSDDVPIQSIDHIIETDIENPSSSSSTLSLPSPPLPSDANNLDLSFIETTCSVCLSEYEEGDSLTLLRCLHVFHYQCVSHWLLTHPSKRACLCPICQQSISSEETVSTAGVVPNDLEANVVDVDVESVHRLASYAHNLHHNNDNDESQLQLQSPRRTYTSPDIHLSAMRYML
eukprot:gene4888-9747_t